MSVQRYKVGYYTDEWGMSSNTPCLLRDDNGYAVKFDDYALLKKQRDELLAAQQWKPIETAPMDGKTVIIGRDMGDFGFVRGYGHFEGARDSFVSGWISRGFNEIHGNLGLAHPTHWMPLPNPPPIASASTAAGTEQSAPALVFYPAGSLGEEVAP